MSRADGLSYSGRRTKGVNAEREVADIWRAHGLEVRGLEGLGDHLVIVPAADVTMGGNVYAHSRPGFTIHSEVKRQERTKLPEWTLQAERECPAGCIAVVAWRPSRREWRADLTLQALAELVAR